MGVRCQIIMWLRLRGALRVGPACRCGRTGMMSAACVHILKSHRQTGGRGIVFFRFLLFSCMFLLSLSLHRPSARCCSPLSQSALSLHNPAACVFFFLGVNTRVEQRTSSRQMMSWADGSLTETDCSPQSVHQYNLSLPPG